MNPSAIDDHYLAVVLLPLFYILKGEDRANLFYFYGLAHCLGCFKNSNTGELQRFELQSNLK